jgi:gliding motility-associated-like protein
LAYDSCDNPSSFGNEAVPIFLEGKIIGRNEAVVLQFNPYEKWGDSMVTYRIEVSEAGVWSEINKQTSSTDFVDQDFLAEEKLEKCYRIVASDRELLSTSNTICLPYIPMLFIPTSFTPNNDGLNDKFSLITYGIKEYQMSIYDRWGGLITNLSKGESWSGESAPIGSYFVQITYTDVLGLKHQTRATISLIR